MTMKYRAGSVLYMCISILCYTRRTRINFINVHVILRILFRFCLFYTCIVLFVTERLSNLCVTRYHRCN